MWRFVFFLLLAFSMDAQIIPYPNAHGQGATLRFWGVPHDEEVWQFLLDVGVDHINVDNLGRLKDFLAGSEE